MGWIDNSFESNTNLDVMDETRKLFTLECERDPLCPNNRIDLRLVDNNGTIVSLVSC